MQVDADTIARCWRKADILPSVLQSEVNQKIGSGHGLSKRQMRESNIDPNALVQITALMKVLSVRDACSDDMLNPIDYLDMPVERWAREPPPPGPLREVMSDADAEHIKALEQDDVTECVDDEVPVPTITLQQARTAAQQLSTFLGENSIFDHVFLMDSICGMLDNMQVTVRFRQQTLDGSLAAPCPPDVLRKQAHGV